MAAALAPALVFSQDESSSFNKLTDLLLPAPNATAIIKYGEASVNKNTGTANISIPLFSVKGSKIAASVSLGYNSGGIRVDEIASRVGMGWALNAGGVITHTVRGLDDIISTRHNPYAAVDVNYQTWNFMRRIFNDANNNAGGYDSEPDLFNFSFDGNSGSFVLDNDMNIVQIAQQGLRIEKNFANAAWTFKITTTEGVVYLFGGTDATETTKRTSSCARSYNAYVPTAWYLKQVVHPNGEVINFTYTPLEYEYDNGVSQTMYKAWVNISGCPPPPMSPATCINVTKTKGVLLSGISIPGMAAINFNYTTREDCNDKLLSSVYYKDPTNTVGYYEMSYTTATSDPGFNNEYRAGNNKTPYLAGVTEKSADGLQEKKHYFSYVDPGGRPSRLSFSQDHWGYFNGSVNSSFTPKLPLIWDQLNFPAALANREADFAYAQKGMLKKVVYPTGGSTTLFYEPNSYDAGTNYFSTGHTLSCDVTGTGNWDENSRSKQFQIGSNPAVNLHITCVANGTINLPYSNHVKGSVDIINLATNSIVFSREFLPGYETEEIMYATPGNYLMVLKAYGTLATTQVIFKHNPTSIASTVPEKLAGGVRVAKIATAVPDSAPMIKRYFYGPLNDLNTSSLFYVQNPQYRGQYKTIIPCEGVYGGRQVYTFETINSYSLLNLGVFNGSQTSYAAVTESIGENFEGGGIESKFYTGIDVAGNVLWNSFINEAPLSNFSSLQNSRPRSETIVKRMPNSQLKPLKSTVYTYTIDSASQRTIYGYSVNRSLTEGAVPDTTCNLSAPGPPGFPSCYAYLAHELGAYNMMRYHIMSNRINPETTTETLWDENGDNPVVTVTNSFYSNPLHNQLTKTETVNSKGQTVRTTLTYPHDYITAPYPAMVSYNNIAAVVNAKSDIITPSNTVIPVSEVKTNYGELADGLYAPLSIEKSTKGNAFDIEGTIQLYDAKGHILQYKGKDDIVNSMIWGYNNQYPVAKITGATYSQATAQLTVTLAALQSLDGQALRDELNHIRTGLSNAMAITYTYKHLTGVSSITDPDNKTNTYEYDAFNRLLIIKDQDGNVVKKMDYVYATPDPATGVTIYYNQPASQSFTCNTCSAGYVASPLTYAVPAGRYYSLLSQADANTKAAADITASGQDYVNRNSMCSNAATCSGWDYKFVSCACEQGEHICEYSTPDGNGGWIAHYHLRWSDGSTGVPFTENVTGCSGADKKYLNCVCETGLKVCDNTTNNGGGSYTVTYRYHWSDNSYSSPITEIITCSGIDKKLIDCNCETAIKVYVSSEFCNLSNADGCCSRKWRCGFYYKWSDNSTLGDVNNLFYECSDESCMGGGGSEELGGGPF